MALQLQYAAVRPVIGDESAVGVAHQSITFVPFNIYESISLLTLNFPWKEVGGGALQYTCKFGIYSLNAGTLNLVNYISRTMSHNAGQNWWADALTATSAEQNLTPGTWYIGLLFSTGGTNEQSILAGSLNAANAFPAGFYGGAMTVATSELPNTYATSDLSTTGGTNLRSVYMVLTA